MNAKHIVTMYKHGNTMFLDPTTDRIFAILKPVLSFREQVAYHGYEATQRKRMGLAKVEFVDHTLFELDHRHRIVTTFGFWKVARDELRKAGYEVRLKDMTPPDPAKFEPHWHNIEHYKLRENQPEFLQKILTNRCGRFDCPPGFGKSFMIGLVAALLPKAKIDVVTRRVAVLRDRIYPELVQMVGDVGIVGGGKKVLNKRVMCYTVGSMGHSPATADILIADECLTGDALVQTSAGLIPIKDVCVGTEVVCYDGTTIAVRPVTRVWAREPRPVLRLTTGSGRTLRCTTNHPIATTTGWIPAGQLVPGNLLLGLNENPSQNAVETIGSNGGTLLGWRCHTASVAAGNVCAFPPDRHSTSSYGIEGQLHTAVISKDTANEPQSIGSNSLQQSDRLCSARCLATHVLSTPTKAAGYPGCSPTTEDCKKVGQDTNATFCDGWVGSSGCNQILVTAITGSPASATASLPCRKSSSWSGQTADQNKLAELGLISWGESAWRGGCVTTAEPTETLLCPYTPKAMTTNLPTSLRTGCVNSDQSAENADALADGISTCIGSFETTSGNLSTNTFPTVCPINAERLIAIELLPLAEPVYDLEVEEHHNFFANGLLVHNCHEMAADNAAAQLVRWQNSRNYGLSASHDMRWDGKDARMHGVFGPIIFRVDYQQAQAANMVVPIEVHWSDVVMDYDPASGYEDVEKKRHAIWKNDFRNAVIARDAHKYDDDTQVLITVDTLEHAMHLKKLLPEFTLVYMENGLSTSDRDKYAKLGCCEPDEPFMTFERRQQLTKDFETGKLKKAICTTVWNVGVSFNKLAVLIRAAAGGSSINDIQIPGRVSRVAEGKDCGVVHDYLDQFSMTYRRQAAMREKTYEMNGWRQMRPGKTKLGSQLI